MSNPNVDQATARRVLAEIRQFRDDCDRLFDFVPFRLREANRLLDEYYEQHNPRDAQYLADRREQLEINCRALGAGERLIEPLASLGFDVDDFIDLLQLVRSGQARSAPTELWAPVRSLLMKARVKLSQLAKPIAVTPVNDKGSRPHHDTEVQIAVGMPNAAKPADGEQSAVTGPATSNTDVTKDQKGGYIPPPDDSSPYVLIQKLVNEFTKLSYHQVVRIIEEPNNGVCWTRPLSGAGKEIKNRRLVHLNQWLNYEGSHRGVGKKDDWPEMNQADIEHAKANMRARKRAGS